MKEKTDANSTKGNSQTLLILPRKIIFNVASGQNSQDLFLTYLDQLTPAGGGPKISLVFYDEKKTLI